MTSLITALANHLWQSTLFALAVGGLTLLLRRNSARIRHLLWLAASAKFLVPFAWLTESGQLIPRPMGLEHAAPPDLVAFGHEAAQLTRFNASGATSLPEIIPTAHHDDSWLIACGALWALGILVVTIRWLRQWRQIQCALRDSASVDLPFPVPVHSSPVQLEPAVVGVLRPVLLLPKGMEQRLSALEMRAVLAHEACHVARRDNLSAAMHMIVQALFWFHPLIWWLGQRLVDERERACDEAVLAAGHAPRSYAEGILKVCEHYVQIRLASVAGIGGADLSRRIKAIMSNRKTVNLNAGRRILLALAACAALGLPIGIGVFASPQVQAQAPAADDTEFHNVSIQVAPAGGNLPSRNLFSDGHVPANHLNAWVHADGQRIHMDFLSLRSLIAGVYGVTESQVVGQDWNRQPNYRISADDPRGVAAPPISVPSTGQPGLRAILARNFGLVARLERRRMPGYVLSISPAGSKLTPDEQPPGWKKAMWSSPDDGISATGFPVSPMVELLEQMLQQPVVDRTGLQGSYDYNFSWKPSSPAAPDPATLAASLEQQLGLRLEAKTVTVDVINVVSLKSPDQIITPPPATHP